MAGCKAVGLDKVGPLSVVDGEITPVTHLFQAIYRSYNPVYNWFLGPPCPLIRPYEGTMVIDDPLIRPHCLGEMWHWEGYP